MTSSPSFDRRRALLLAIPALLAVSLSGCVDQYPESLHYTTRTDPLVTDTFKNVPISHFDPPGHLGHLLGLVKDDSDRNLLIDPNKMTPTQRQKLGSALEASFGTPLHPKALADDEELRKALHLDEPKLAEGSRLYRLHCLHCHGLTGNGRGPTAAWVNPHPRDFRSGIFKFTSSSQGDKVRKPRREDLLRTLRHGIEGTAMPSFIMQPEKDLDALVSYVTHLSLRGQVEFLVIRDLVKPQDAKLEDNEIADKVKELATAYAGFWKDAETKIITPPEAEFPADKAASIMRGYKLFQKDGMGCISCHMDYGRQNNYLPDSWGTIVRAADLTQGVYRGGRRPIDLYWRVSYGINGANMPSSEAKPPKDIWDVVNFLMVLPYPKMRAEYLKDEQGQPINFHQ